MKTSKRAALVGGSGFVGRNLSASMVNRGFEVLVIDIAACPPELSALSGLTHCQLDMTDAERLTQVLKDFQPSIVVDIAGWGMSGPDMLDPHCNTVNVLGTERLLNACVACGISRLIYTSTYNVVFGGVAIDDGDESQPYVRDADHLDEYSRSKARAEQLVLQFNGRALPNGSKLITSVIRPAAIYGENEQRHLPRILKHIDMGLFLVRIGAAKVDWVHVENMVEAYLLLADKLLTLDDPSITPAGRAYFINDGSPMDNFEFLKPLCLTRDRSFPSIILPVQLMFIVSRVLELLYFAGKIVNIDLPLPLTRAEVAKVGVSHHFSTKNAFDDFGYRPKFDSIEGGRRLGAFYRSYPRTNCFEIAAPIWYFLIISGMSMLFAVASFDDERIAGHTLLRSVSALGLLIFRSKTNLKVVFQCAVLTHFLEAIYAFTIAKRFCPNTTALWFGQTLLLGYPSLRLLLNHSQRSH